VGLSRPFASNNHLSFASPGDSTRLALSSVGSSSRRQAHTTLEAGFLMGWLADDDDDDDGRARLQMKCSDCDEANAD
jgi:hypothetical protein